MKYPIYPTLSLLSSAEAEDGATRLLDKIHDGRLGLPVLPNSYTKYAGKQEEEDYKSYCRFLSSSNGRKLLQRMEAQDDRKNAEI